MGLHRSHGAAIAAAGLVLASCASGIGREDAISTLQLRGASAAEAVCMADSLAAVDRLDAADPTRPLSEGDRELLVSANDRCSSLDPALDAIGVEVLSGASTASPIGPGIVAPFGDADEEAPDTGVAPMDGELDVDRAVAAGMARLTGVGRSVEFARCVVNHLLAVDAPQLLASPEFGMGLDPAEADAFASCA